MPNKNGGRNRNLLVRIYKLINSFNNMENTIHHYTTIETLALILKSKSIRFNRLDRVDDLEESNTISNGINLSKYTFVSCWTETNEESIPLWKMYANGENGIKISLEKDPFEDYTIKNNPLIHVEDGSILCKIPQSEFSADAYSFVPPPFSNSKSDYFYRSIVYVDDVRSKIEGIIKFNQRGFKIEFGQVARYKHKRWKFQDEHRFVLTAIPYSLKNDYLHPEIGTIMKNRLLENIELPFTDYYLKLKDSSINNMIVTLSPNSSISQEIIVKSLLNEFAPNAKLKHSSLKNSVKMKY